MKKNCEICGNEFTTVPSKIKKGHGRFCSHSCSTTWRNNKREYKRTEETRKCAICGSTFRCHPNRTWQACSRKCGRTLKSINGRAWIKCAYCGKDMFVPRSRNEKHEFCCRKCYLLWKERESMGEKNRNWKGGSSSDGCRRVNTQAWKRLRKQVLDVCGNKCALCGRSDKPLSIHHIVPYRICREDKIENLVPMCRSCHSFVDNKKDVLVRGYDFIYARGDKVSRFIDKGNPRVEIKVWASQ